MQWRNSQLFAGLPGVLVDGAELLELPVADGDDVLGEQRHRRHVRRPDHVAALQDGDHSYLTSAPEDGGGG